MKHSISTFSVKPTKWPSKTFEWTSLEKSLLKHEKGMSDKLRRSFEMRAGRVVPTDQTLRVLISIYGSPKGLDTLNSQAGKHLGQWESRRSASRARHVCQRSTSVPFKAWIRDEITGVYFWQGSGPHPANRDAVPLGVGRDPFQPQPT